jgi:tetratricopeptide (TPR) repeat protein
MLQRWLRIAMLAFQLGYPVLDAVAAPNAVAAADAAGAPAAAGEVVPVRGYATQAAIDRARDEASAHPTSADAQFDLALVYAHTPFAQEALDALRLAGESDPDYARAIVERYAAILVEQPDDAQATLGLGLAYYLAGDRHAAYGLLKHLIALTPDDAWAFGYLGFVEENLASDELATASWQHALELDANNPLSLFLLGQVYTRKGRYAEAEESIEKALKQRSSSGLRP